MVYLKPKQLIIKDCARRFVLKLYRHEASRSLFVTAELLVLSSSAGCTQAVPCILRQARVMGGSTLVARVGQKSHFYHTQLVGRGLAAPSQKLHPLLGPDRLIRHHWIIMPLKTSFPIFRFPFFLLHFSFPFFRFLFFPFPFYPDPVFLCVLCVRFHNKIKTNYLHYLLVHP